jgi:hypothetical protein
VEAPDLHRTKITDIAFHDPMSDETRKVRTHLLFVAALTILVKVYGLRLVKLPWLDFDIPANAPQLLDGLLSVVLLYLLSVFVLYAWQDFRRWRLAGELHLVNSSFDLLLASRNDFFAIAQSLDKLTCGEPLHPQLQKAISDAAVRLPQATAKLEALRSSLRRLNRLQWFRVTVIEFALPTILGLFALFKVGASLLPFLRATLQ